MLITLTLNKVYMSMNKITFRKRTYKPTLIASIPNDQHTATTLNNKKQYWNGTVLKI